MNRTRALGSKKRSLDRAVDRFERRLAALPEEYDFFFHPGKHLFFTFLKGIVSGLGVIVAAAIVIPLVLWMLRGIQWVPLLGDFVERVAEHIQDARTR